MMANFFCRPLYIRSIVVIDDAPNVSEPGLNIGGDIPNKPCGRRRRNKRAASAYTPAGTWDSEIDGKFIAGTWRQANNEEMTSFLPLKLVPRKSAMDAIRIREELREYCVEEGRLPWQDQYA
jgi:hypothetical protein